MTVGSRLYRIRQNAVGEWYLSGLVAFGHYMYLAGGFASLTDTFAWLDDYRKHPHTIGHYVAVHSE